MDKDRLARYRGIIRRMILDIAKMSEGQGARDGLETLAVCDDRRGRYLLVNVGWQLGRHVDAITVHVRLQDGKVWLEDDMTNLAIADMLVEAGIPKKKIVLGFHSPERRKYTDFAAA